MTFKECFHKVASEMGESQESREKVMNVVRLLSLIEDGDPTLPDINIPPHLEEMCLAEMRVEIESSKNNPQSN